MFNIISHRGLDNHKFKENTLEAFKDSLAKDYIDGIELDVRMTKDKKIVIYHNPFIIKSGIHIISKTKYSRLMKCCMKEIMLLDTFLSTLNTKKQIIIEIKEESEREKKLASKLLPILDNYPHLNIIICSFNNKLLQLIEEINNNYRLGIIISKLINYKYLKNNYHFSLVKYNLKDKVKFTKPIYFWTVNEMSEFQKITNIKSSYLIGIITDNAYKFDKKD